MHIQRLTSHFKKFFKLTEEKSELAGGVAWHGAAEDKNIFLSLPPPPTQGGILESCPNTRPEPAKVFSSDGGIRTSCQEGYRDRAPQEKSHTYLLSDDA